MLPTMDRVLSPVMVPTVDATAPAVATTAIDGWQLGYPSTIVTDLTIAHGWGGHSVDENQKWSLEFIEAMAKSKLTTTSELMK